MDVERLLGPAEAEAALGAFLVADEARHNLPLGLLATALATPEVYPELVGWVVRDGGAVVGGALRTPPYNLIVLREAVAGAVESLAAAIGGDLPGAIGGVPEIDAFA